MPELREFGFLLGWFTLGSIFLLKNSTGCGYGQEPRNGPQTGRTD